MIKTRKTIYSMIEMTDDRSSDIAKGVCWLIEQGGGTIFASQKRVIQDALNLDTDGQFKRFEESCAKKGISLCWPRRSHSVSGNVLALYCNTDLLAEFERYGDIAKLLYLPWTERERDWFEASYMVSGDRTVPLPSDIDRILAYIANMAAGYSSGMNYREEHRLKCDLMDNWSYWRGVDPAAVRTRCIELGMMAGDADVISGLVKARKEGKRFAVPKGTEPFRH